jgi:GWxTD domain-containing protein
MKKTFIVLWTLLLLSVAFSQMAGKRQTQYGFEINVKPAVFYDVYITFNEQKLNPQLNVLFSIQNDLLFFTKSEDGFSGGYDIALVVKDINSRSTVFTHVWKEKIYEKEFEQTNSKKRYQVNGKTFETNLLVGDYEVHLELTDEATGNSFKSKRNLEIPELESSIYFNLIKLFNKDDSLSAEIILGEGKSTVEFNRDLLATFDMIHSTTDQISLTSILYQMKDENKNEIRRKDHSLSSENKWIRFNEILDMKILEEGNYLLTYTIKTGEGESEINKRFSVVWYKKPIYLYDDELAIPPLKYILSQEEWNTLEDLSDQELSIWIKDFWRQRDPDPNTPLNEIMVEFYDRVLQANKKFAGQYNEGWTTDRGKSLILYGEPDHIEAYRYRNKSKPYEIWYYQSENKKLIFIDVDEDDTYPLMSVEDIGEKKNE